jgi:hypothetical protein
MGFDYGRTGEAVEWTILTIGHLSVNQFWGEKERQRGPLCTSTLVSTSAGLAIIDPSVHPPQMAGLLNDQAGSARKRSTQSYLPTSTVTTATGLRPSPTRDG